MSQKMLASLLALAFAVGLGGAAASALGGDEPGVAPAHAPRAEGLPRRHAKLRIGVSIPAATHGWTAGLGWWAEKAMKEHADVEWLYQRASTPEQQAQQVENMIVQEIDALVILCIESAPLTPVGRKVKEAGIYLFSVDRGFEPKETADVFLEGDNHSFGRKSAAFMAEKLGGKGKIVVLTGIPCTVDSFRREGFMEVIKKSPGIEVLDQQPSNWNEEKSMKVMQTMLAKHDRIDAVWAQDDGTARGAAQAIKEANRQHEMWVMGGAGRKDIVKEVMDKNPMFPADVTYSPAMIAAGIHLCVADVRDGNEKAVASKIPAHLGMNPADLREKRAENEKFRYIKLDVHLITPDNAKDFYFADSVY